MILILALLGYFCLVGLAVRRFDASARWLLLAGITAMAVLAFALRSLP